MSHGGGGGFGGGFGHSGGGHHHGAHHMGGEPDQSLSWTQAFQAEKEEGGWARFFRKIRTTPATLMGLLFLGMTGWLFVVYASSHGGGDKKNLADLRYFPTNKYEHSIRSAAINTPWQRDSTKGFDFSSQSQPEAQAPAEAPAAAPAPKPVTTVVVPPQRPQDLLTQQSSSSSFNNAFGSSAAGSGSNSFVPSSGGSESAYAPVASGNDTNYNPKSDVVNYSIPVSPRISARVSASGLVPPPPPSYNQSTVSNSVQSLARAYAISQLDGTQGAGTSLAGLLTQSRSDFGGAPGEVSIAPPAGRLFPPPPGIPPPPGQVTQTQLSDSGSSGGGSSVSKNPYVKTMMQPYGSGGGSRSKLVVSR